MSSILNTAKVNGSNTAASTGNSTITSISTAETTLSVAKVADAETVLVGNDVTYTITIKNTGTITATNVKFTDTLASSFLTYVSATADNNTAISYDSTTHLISGNLGNIAGGATVIITLVATVIK